MTKESRTLWEENRKIIENVVSMLDYSRRQQYFFALQYSAAAVNGLIDNMELLLKLLPELDGEAPFASEQSLLEMLEMMRTAQEQEDYVLLADFFEESLLPVLVECQRRIVAGEEPEVDLLRLRDNIMAMEDKIPGILQLLFQTDIRTEYDTEGRFSSSGMERVHAALQRTVARGYSVEFTAGGGYTVAVPELSGGAERFYLHTNNIIARESLALASEWLGQKKQDYLFYGLGFGYPYQQMLALDENITVSVVEGNLDILLLAVLFAPLAELLKNPRFRLYIDITNRRLFALQQENPQQAFYIHFPSLKGIRSQRFRRQLEEYFVSESSVRTQRQRMESNFRKNRQYQMENVCSLQAAFAGKDLYIIAGGPSLDKNCAQLSALQDRDDSIILATGTVLKKLLQRGIRPDYGIITDSGSSVSGQVQGMIQDIPLLLLSTVNSSIVSGYAGRKYVIYQRDYPLAEEAGREEGAECFETGGSVSTTALDIGIRFGCRRIIFVGLDLAYTGGQTHASDTLQVRTVLPGRYQTEAVDGSMVMTAKNLNLYREWIESRVQRMRAEQDWRPVIDATEGGAKKKGLTVMKLQDVIGREEPK